MRDLRIDSLRGPSLIVIFIDHLSDTAMSLNGGHFYFPTLRNFGFCSAAEFFVFFSRYVFGVVYIKNLDRYGFWKCQLKALARVRYIFTANLIMFAMVAALTFLFPNKPQPYMEYSDLWLLYSDFGTALAKFALFQYFPVYTDILPLYMVLLVFSPGILLLVKTRLLAGMAISLAIYVAAARTPWLNLPLISASGEHWLFDPFSWQLLFVMGIALGSRGGFARIHVPSKRTILSVIGLALGAIAILKSLAVVGKVYQVPSLAALSSIAALPGMDLRTVGPMRLLYFVSLLFFIMGIMPTTETLRRMRCAKPLIACGQSSLEIFCLGTLLCQLGGLALYEINGNYLAYLPVIAFGTLVMLGTGLILTRAVSITPLLRSDHARRLAARPRL
jgi:hypothetical protein